MRTVGRAACGVLVLAALLTGCGGSTINREKILFEVKKGDRFPTVARRLQEQGIVDNPRSLVTIARLRFRANALKYGVYQIEPRESYSRLVDRLTSGQSFSHRLTIPEGSTVFQIADILETKGLVNRQSFISACSNRKFLTQVGLQAPGWLEGFLFPDTYQIPLNYSEDQIIQLLIDNFLRAVDADTRRQAARRGMDLKKVVTLASIIEKEAGQEFEKPIISGVFHNRMRQRYRLQSCATLIYALTLDGRYDGNIRNRDFVFPSKYNTYQVFGLPPGPIANPGRTSILAAIYPADTGYLYFVSKQDGTHHFSRTLAEHNAAVQKYQIQPAVESRKNRSR